MPDLGRGFSPARADCGYRAPLAPRLARPCSMVACGPVTRIVEIPAEPPSPDPGTRGERESLLGWLWYQRASFARKCVGLTREQLIEMNIPPSRLSLLGLVRHLSEMERSHFRQGVGGEPLPPIYCTDSDPDGDFEGAATSDPDEAFAMWRRERDGADAAISAIATLDQPGAGKGRSFRWSLMKIIAEYARHNGHADLLRERLDGTKSE